MMNFPWQIMLRDLYLNISCLVTDDMGLNDGQ